MRRLIPIFMALAFFPTLASGQTCAVDSFTLDPTEFEHLAVEDFQGFALDNWNAVTEADPIVAAGAAIWGMVWPTNGWCIPGMDNGGSCGGTNIYLASAIDLHVEPLSAVSQIGFRYGTQGQDFHILLTLSDGSEHHFTPEDLHTNAWGGQNNYGFFGYCTGDDTLTISHVYMWGADGGIDDLRLGNPVPECTDNNNDGVCDICSIDQLRAEIEALPLPGQSYHSLTNSLDKTTAMLEKGKVAKAIKALEQLASKITKWSGKHIEHETADALLDCIYSLIADLEE
ncbi:MAG: hypothetical protein ACI9OJ_001319 [Myxococcota bacterium]|jgi:hypothetical protein